MRSSERALCALAALVVAAVGVSCGDNPTAPSNVTPIAISCPAAQTAQSLDGNPVLVTYPNPTVTGGSGLVSTSCTPSTSGQFPVGATNVTCSARDTRAQSASCAFQVTVTRVPRISVTRFVAFGDSMTEGFVQVCRVSTFHTLAGILADLDSLRTARPPGFSAVSYPTKLQAMLASRYAAQAITMVNEGNGGETAAQGAVDFGRVMNTDMPQAVLLLEGINDIHQGTPLQSSAIPTVVSSLRVMVQDAKRRGIVPFLATLLPERRGACRGFDWDDGIEDVAAANAQIRQLAASENVTLVDLYPAFVTATDTLLGQDGLHPSEAGYQRMADLFLAAIQQRLEQ